MIEWIIITVLAIVAGGSIFALHKQNLKSKAAVEYCEMYVQLLGAVYLQVKHVVDTMAEVDRLGAFEADDEVGHTFKAIKQVQDDLYKFLTKYVNQEESKDGGEDESEEGTEAEEEQ